MTSTTPTAAQLDLLNVLSKKAGFGWAGNAALAHGIKGKRGQAPDPRFDINKAQIGDLIDALKSGDLVAPVAAAETSAVDRVKALMAELGVSVKDLL